MPDFFVPLDTAQFTPLHRQLVAKGIVLNANLKYVDKHRRSLRAQTPAFSDFKARFEVPQSLIDEVLREGEKQGIKPKDKAELQRTLPYLRLQLKALIARDLWDMSEYFSIMNEENRIVQKAVQLIR